MWEPPFRVLALLVLLDVGCVNQGASFFSAQAFASGDGGTGLEVDELTDPAQGEDGMRIDAGDPSGALPGDAIPRTCTQAAGGATSVGCTFYAVDMDTSNDALQFAVAAANVQEDKDAHVSVQRKLSDGWANFSGPLEIPPLGLHEFMLVDSHQEHSGVRRGGAYRIVSDVPIVAYQFSPIDGATSFLSDASMLYPASTWDSVNHVVNVGFESSTPGSGYPYVTVVGGADGTQVSFTAASDTLGGGVVPQARAGETVSFTLDDGDVATIVAAQESESLAGSRVITSPEKPVAVLPGHACVNIPDHVCCCDHMEEQLSGVRQWGRSFVAAHMPERDTEGESTFWQVYASENQTTVDFTRRAGVEGVPTGPVVLDAGETAEFFVTSQGGAEADFRVEADKAVAVVGYMTSAHNVPNQQGDPAMVQFVSVEQFLPRYVILVPHTWENDKLVVTRPAGAPIFLDGMQISDAEFSPVADGTWEVARVNADDGVHVLDGSGQSFGVVVVGWDDFDSYAYVGGTGTGIINPAPVG